MRMVKGGMPAAAARTVMITGVSRGLGRALAVEMARRGHTVIGLARAQESLLSLQAQISSLKEEVGDEHGPPPSSSNHIFKPLDIRSDDGVQELAKLVAQSRQVPDIIVNNAGTINKNNKLWEVSAEEFSMVIDTNVKGVANVIRHFLPLMIEKKQGIVVNMSSGWGRSGASQVAPYCASKWAIEGLSRSVAREVPAGMAIVALSPGVVNTDMLTSCFGTSAEMYETPEAWAPRAADMILNLTDADNGASLTV